MVLILVLWKYISVMFHENLNNTVVLFWHFFEQFFADVLRFSLYEFIKIVEYDAVSCARTPFSCAIGYLGTAFFCAVIGANPWYLKIAFMVLFPSHLKEVLCVDLLDINVTNCSQFIWPNFVF